jgi:hypothetical protein
MRLKLNERAFAHARRLIEEGRVALDERERWSAHRPSPEAEDRFIEANGFAAYTAWYLGVDEEEEEESKARYKLPFGDLERVHRCGVLAAEARAGQYRHVEVERAAAQLRRLIEALEAARAPASRPA